MICGTGIIHYEHVDPEFVDCKEHNPKAMTLLCPTCHDKKTRRFLSTSTIKSAMDNPKALQDGFSSEILDIGTKLPNVILGGNLIKGCRYPLLVEGIPFMEIKPPEETGAPCSLSAIFLNLKGQISLKIEDNEWTAYNSNWDIEVTGGKIKISFSKDRYALILNVSNRDVLEIEYLDCIMGNKRINGNQNMLVVRNLNNGGTINYGGNLIVSKHIGFNI